MNPHPHENPDLTAYSLGELDAQHAAQVHGLLRISPTAASEMEQIEAVAQALSQTAPVPVDRLHPAQRRAVLNPAQMPRMMAPLMPRPMPARRRSAWPVLAGMMKAAAVIALSLAGYWVGRHSDWMSSAPSIAVDDASIKGVPSVENPPLVAATTEPQLELAKPAPVEMPVTPDEEVKPVEIVIVEEKAAPPAAVEVAAASPATDQSATEPVVLVESPPNTPAAPAPVVRALTRPAAGTAFVSTTRQAVSQFALRPADIRPAPPQPAPGQTFAAPMTARPEVRDEAKPPRAPELYIHSWKADVAVCPWNPAHRLMRVVIQLPADQPAATQSFSYPLHVAFDPNNVREYRQLCERHLPAGELRSAGTHSLWYEYLPNGKSEPGKNVATITLPQGRFTTQTVGPFDGSKLSVTERGLDWRSAREDFIFDTAVVGFGLLLRGVNQSPALNHQLVLTLAEKTLDSDSTGERRRFVRQVREAKAAAGL
ncbi:MAG TPA: hypothetical protein DIT64_17925 [Verrucomicrobiales bacterium]|nr:hypothetical protein [Verrucomicrobiales bacterium]